MIHPATGLNDIVHQRTRLGILTILQEAGGPVDFVALRDQLAVSDGSLSQHIRVLEEASYATIEKSFAGKRPRTRIKITKPGTKALAHELELLRQIVALDLSA